MKMNKQASQRLVARATSACFGLALAFALPANATDFYAAPGGSSSGNGSQATPWDLQTALNQPSSVHPGDTIWLLGGTYQVNGHPWKFNSALAGTSTAQITVRAMPGQRVTVDGNITQLTGGYVTYWGLEIMNSQQFGSGFVPKRTTSVSGPFPEDWWITYNGQTTDYCVSGFDDRAPGCKLINVILHDNIGGGLGFDIAAGTTYVYGLISYYNGWQSTVDRGHGHGIYGQNTLPNVKSVIDSIVFDNFALGMQATGAGPSSVADAFDVEGSTFFMNGELATKPQAELLIGPFQGVTQNSVVKNNCLYDPTNWMTGSDFNMGYDGGSLNGIVESNYFQTSTWWSGNNQNLTVLGNTFINGEVNNFNPANYPNNTYLTSNPTQNAVFIRPNQYEPGRGNITIYNWQNLNSVSVDVSSFLPVGTPYKVVNAQNFFGTPVLSGTYQGGAITLPMTGLTPATPVGIGAPPPSGPAFNAFVVLPLTSVTNSPGGGTNTNGGGTGTTNTAPTISTVGNQTLTVNQASAALPITVSDGQTSAASLTLAAVSSNPTLVPNANVAFGGSGANRTVTVTPASNQSGTAKITLTVSDGTLTSSSSFNVTVSGAAPVISSIAAQTTYVNIATTVPFTVSDADVSVANVTVSATSSNPTLVPNVNISVGGSGSNRTVTINPAANQSGTATINLVANDGVASSTNSFGLTVSTDPAPSQKVYIPGSLSNALIVAPMVVTTNSTNPADDYVSSPTANTGSVSWLVNIPVAGVYDIWGRVLSPSYAADSFYVSVDGGTEDVYDDAENTWTNAWQWTVVNGRNGTSTPATLNPRTFLLSQGTHTIKFRAREANAILSSIMVTDDLSYVPQDFSAVNESLTAAANQTTQFPTSTFLGNANNAAGGTVLLSLPAVYTTAHGTVTYCGGNVSYTPAPGFTGTDTFNFTLNIAGGANSSATATVTVH